MKKRIVYFICILIITLLIILFSACPPKAVEPEKPVISGFWANNTVDNSYYKVPSTKLYEGLHCILYVENANSNKCSAATAQIIANEYDNNIYSKIINTFGTAPDVDINNKIIILILDIKDGFSGIGSYVAGFFDPLQEYDNPSLKAAGYPEASNEADMLYMDCYPSIVASTAFYETIAHESQHMINFNQKAFVQNSSSPQDTWINEGLSSSAETVYSGNIVSWKVNYYNGTGYDNSSIKNGENFLYWRGDGASYSTVYLFFQWLRAQSSNGDGIYKEIINLTSNNYQDVLSRAQSRFASYSSATWQTMIRDWFIANLYNTTGIHGYGSLAVSTSPAKASSGTYNLFPGDGLYMNLASSTTPTVVANIGYIGLKSDKITTYTTTPFLAGDVLLTYNYDGVDTNSSRSVSLSGAQVETQNTSLKSYNIITNTYPIDAIIKSPFLNKK